MVSNMIAALSLFTVVQVAQNTTTISIILGRTLKVLVAIARPTLSRLVPQVVSVVMAMGSATRVVALLVLLRKIHIQPGNVRQFHRHPHQQMPQPRLQKT